MTIAATPVMAQAAPAQPPANASGRAADVRQADTLVPTPMLSSDGQASVTQAGVSTASVTAVNGVTGAAPSPAQATQMIEDYFNGISSMKADFRQHVTGAQTSSEGTFYWKKPGKFLWQYDTPIRQKIVDTGTAVYYVDQTRNDQATQLPMNAGVARLFNARTLNLQRAGLTVRSVHQVPGALQVGLDVTGGSLADKQAGIKAISMTFDYSAQGLQVRSLAATDMTNTTTTVTLENIQTGVRLPDSLFAFTPGVYRQRN